MSSNKEHKKEEERYSKEFSLDETLRSLDRKELYNLLENLVDRNPKIYRLILEWLNNKPRDMKEIDSKKVGILLNDELLLEYWYDAEKIIDEFNEYGGGLEDDEEEACDCLDKISELIKKGNISTKAKFEFLDKAFVQYNYNNSGFEDALMDVFFEICETKEEWRYLVKKLSKHPSRWRNKLIMDIQKEHLQDDDEYLRMRKEDLHYGMDYWDLAEFYIRKGESKIAIEIAEEGLSKGDGRLTELFEFLTDYYAKKKDTVNLERVVQYGLKKKSDEKTLLDRLFKYYKIQNDYENAKKNLVKAFEYVKGAGYIPEVRSYAHYSKMKQFLTEKDWKIVEPKIFKEIRERDIEDYLQICIDKGQKKEVVNILLNPPKKQTGIGFRFDGEYDFDKFARQLEEEFPVDVIEYYWQKAYGNISGGNRNTYYSAARYLKKIKHIYIDILEDEFKWSQRFSDLKTEFKNRRAFLEEVRVVEGIKDRNKEDYDF